MGGISKEPVLSDFKKLLSARFLFTFAVSMQAVILGWRMYTLTGDALKLGLIGLTEAVPAIGLALFAGYHVDRSRPLSVYRGVIAGSLLSGLVMLVSQLPMLGWSTDAQVAGLFLSSFLTGTARGFSQPATYALIPKLVSRADLPRASAWTASTMQVARISGPALGGIIFGVWGITVSSIVICAALVIAIARLFQIHVSPTAPLPPAVKKSMRDELLAGVSFVFRHPILLPALSLDMISVLFGGVTALLPIFASDILHVGPLGLGWLRASPAIGAAVVSLWLTQQGVGKKAGPLLFGCVAGFGVSILVFGLSRDFWLSMAALAASGAFDGISMIIRGTAVQLASPDSMRGRISAVNSIFIGSSNEIGEFESGVAARFLGTVETVLLGGVVCLVTVVVTAICAPSLRRMDLTKMEPDPRAEV